ncbi:MAG: Ig-like domain repeat protein, partial [Chloroflexota bacterium]|nr:Ig-like domain repeat protein [Chloroflexota bacterium]
KGPHAAPGDDGELTLDPALEAAERERLREQGKRLPPPKRQPRAEAAGLFGYVVAVGADCFVIDTYEPVKGGKNMKVLQKESLPGLGLTSTRLAVYPKPKALIEVPGGLAALAPDVPVLVGGAVAGDKVLADVVADLRLAQPGPAPQGEQGEPSGAGAPAAFRQLALEGAWSSGATFTGAMVADAGDSPAVAGQALNQSGSTTLDFKGGFGGPTFEYVANPNVTIFHIGVVRVTFEEFRFIAALAGWSYDFPFAFSAEAPTLIADQHGAISVQVAPRSPAGGYSSFYGGLGVNVGLGFNIWTALGCGTAGLESCSFDKTVNLNMFSLINHTTGAAPMPGQTLDVPEDACPSIGIGIPKTPINAADLGVCNDFVFTGAHFYADLSATGGRITSQRTNLAFDGATPITVAVIPSGGPLGLTLSNFRYTPWLDYGLHFRVRIAYKEVWSSPTMPVDIKEDGTFPAITTPFPLPGSDFVTRDGPQPSAHSVAFRAIPVIDDLSATPNPSLYGQTMAITAAISGALDGETVTFSEGARTLGTAAVSGEAATFRIATLPAGTHAITATYTGSDGYGATHTSSMTIGVVVQPAPLTVRADDKTKQYSDPLPPLTVSYIGLVLGEGPSVLGGQLALAVPADLFSPPGTYAITASGLTSSNYAITFAAGTLTVTQEDARVTYTGARFAATSSPAGDTAQVTLAATVRDITAAAGDPAHDAYPGDIRTATLRFVNRETGATLCSAPIGLVGAADLKTGTAACAWAANLGGAASLHVPVGIAIGGHYLRDDAADNTIVTVARATEGSAITGGGYLVESASAGPYQGADGSNLNVGFTAINSRNGDAPQGSVTIQVRAGDRLYHIKSVALTSLATDPTRGIATLNGTATIEDITDPRNPRLVARAAIMQLTLTDRGEPGAGDTLAITLWNPGGGLWLASNWDGVQTLEQRTEGGNLQVR